MTAISLAGDRGLATDHLEAVRTTLKTQVADILRLHVGPLATLPQHLVYDQVLDTPALLHECFHIFRGQPDLFRTVMVRPDKRPVTSDQEQLWCGRTVADVVRLIVRASAKRYFRATLPPAPTPKAPRPVRLGLMERTAIRFGLKESPPPPRLLPPPLGPADRLYGAFRQNLLFEWQVPLIPGYATLEPPTVHRLGSRILALREPGQIDILAAEGLTPDGRLPLLLDDAKRLRGADNGIDANALQDAFTKLELDVLFPEMVDAHLRRAVAQIASINPRAVEMLIPALETNLRGVTVFLFAAFARLGEKGFRQAMGSHCAIWAMQKLARHIESCRPWPRSLPGMRQASEKALAFAIDLDSGLPAKDTRKGSLAAAAAAAATPPAKAVTSPAVGPARAGRTAAPALPSIK